MKKNFKYAIMSAIALVGAVSFSACQSNEEIVDNPDYNPVEGTVKTQFAIGITSQANATTRMEETTTQATPVFRGMDYFILIPFETTPTATSNRIGSYITAGDNKIKGTEVTAPSEELTGAANYTVFNDVTVPVKTRNFLFYGSAPEGNDVDTKFKKGILTTSDAVKSTAGFNTPASLTFSPTSILPGKDAVVAGGSSVGKNLIDLLTNVAKAKATVSGSEKAWSAVTLSENALLSQAFTNFTALKSGSSFNVQRTIQDLYILVNDLASLADNPYNTLATAIQTAITTGANGNAIGIDATDATGTKLSFPEDAYNGYPADLNLPDGATHIAYESGAFVDKMIATGGDTDQTGAMTTGTKKTKYSTYAFPASLWYWKSTPLRASNEVESTNFTTTQGWNTATSGILDMWYKDAFDEVSGSSKSIALVNPIDYAVGRLDLNIAALPYTSSSPMLDSRKNVMDFTKTKTEDPVHGFKGAIKLTGVLIGYQQQVDWQFIPVTGTDVPEYVMYDKTIPAAVKALGDAATGLNYTLVLQTPVDQTVNIALQFKNDGPDFYGKRGELIPSGGTFYLTGGLTPNEATTGYESGTTDKVFIQDYNTEVTLTIKRGGTTDTTGGPNDDPDGIVDDPEGLQEATNTIPDLRTPQLELCFSVDLTWNPGLTFNVEW